MDAHETVLAGYFKINNYTDPIPEYENAEIKKKIKAKDILESST